MIDVDGAVALGYIGALAIGVVLGLVGGGGSILTVPVLVYVLTIEPVLATAYSLFIVGVVSAVGAVRYWRKDLVDFRTGIIFALPAFLAVYATRRFLIPAIPETIITVCSTVITRDMAIMLLFALVMLVASISMVRSKRSVASENGQRTYNYPMIVLEGTLVGVLTGIVGAGGGFLIIPALVLLARLPMKLAVGTSLLIIAFKSLIGFLGDLHGQNMDWPFLLSFTAISVAGIFLGTRLGTAIKGDTLKKGFGYFILLMGFYIIWKELFAG